MKRKNSYYLVSALIFIALVLQVIQLLNSNNIITDKIVNLALIIGLIFGFVYALENFKKGVAKYSKAYMLIYAITSTYNVIASIISCIYDTTAVMSSVDIVITFVMVIPAFCEASLALRKDLGEKKSFNLVLINMIVILAVAVFDIIYYKDFAQYYAMYIGSVLLALITVIFVKEKYIDKTMRGTK